MNILFLIEVTILMLFKLSYSVPNHVDYLGLKW